MEKTINRINNLHKLLDGFNDKLKSLVTEIKTDSDGDFIVCLEHLKEDSKGGTMIEIDILIDGISFNYTASINEKRVVKKYAKVGYLVEDIHDILGMEMNPDDILIRYKSYDLTLPKGELNDSFKLLKKSVLDFFNNHLIESELGYKGEKVTLKYSVNNKETFIVSFTKKYISMEITGVIDGVKVIVEKPINQSTNHSINDICSVL